MKKNELYTVNEWNQPVFMPKGRLYAFGDFLKSEINGQANAGYMGNWLGANKLSGAAGGLVSAAGTAVGQLGNKLISHGLSSGAGSAVSNIGGAVGSAVSAVNPVLGGIISAGSGIIGGGINALWGSGVDQAKLDAANSAIAQNNSFVSNAGSFDGIQGPAVTVADTNAYKGGVFSSGKAADKNRKLALELANAKDFAQNSVSNNIFNIQNDMMNDALANYSALGGPIDNSMGVIDYGFISDYLTQKKREADAKNKMSGIAPMPAFMPNSYAIGGDLQTNGREYSVGKIYDISEKEANRLKAMGYEFTVVG
jgi:hypothetical protein